MTVDTTTPITGITRISPIKAPHVPVSPFKHYLDTSARVRQERGQRGLQAGQREKQGIYEKESPTAYIKRGRGGVKVCEGIRYYTGILTSPISRPDIKHPLHI